MGVMRELSDDFKLSVRSVAEVFAVLNDLDTRFGRSKRVKFRGKRMTREALVNAAVLHLGSLPAQEQEVALAGSVARLEAHLAETDGERAEAGRKFSAATGAHLVGGLVVEPLPPEEDGPPGPAPKKRARKRGAG